MTVLEAAKQIQTILGVAADGDIGPQTRAAFESLAASDSSLPWPLSHPWVVGKASSFADPEDVRRFRRCKANGGTDMTCFRVGDNGIGRWGDNTSEGSGPAVALPPEDWEQFGDHARNKRVEVIANGRSALCFLRDTLPRRSKIKNGVVIDLGPDAAKMLDLKPPFLVAVKWRYV